MTPSLSIADRHDRLLPALHDAEQRRELELQLPGYLREQRWFGGQARTIEAVALQRWVELEGGACLCVAAVTDSHALRTEHQLLLRAGAGAGGRREILDGLSSGPVRAELLRLALGGGAREGHRARLVCEPVASPGRQCEGEGRLAGVEQSNSSVVYGEGCILKLYRRLENGPNPEVQLGRYLTAKAGFDAIPALLSTAALHGADGYRADALMVQAYVPNRGDGWAWALDAARRALAAMEDPETSPSTDRMQIWLDAEGTTLEAVGSLGRVTAELHAALARATAEGMRPEPVTGEDLREWEEAVRREATETADTPAPDSAYYLRRSGPSLKERLARLGPGPRVDPADAGLKTRVHGDYHLGQALRTDVGWALVDFEGEPARPLRERLALQHPLVDVAGMLRSFDYAAATASAEVGGLALPHAHIWRDIVQWRFLEAYRTVADVASPRFLPRDERALRQLLTLFHLRKALYEVRYERNNRPDWAWIPEAAVWELLEDPDVYGAGQWH